MLLSTIKEEFVFHCQVRKLSPRTINNYAKQIDYLLNFLSIEKGITDISDVSPKHIQEFLVAMNKKGRTVNYVNDLLKAYKVYFRYAYNEGYTPALLTEKIHNQKGAKTIIRTFPNQEIKRLIEYYHGYDYLSIRNKVILLLFIDTGIRLNELLTLTAEQISRIFQTCL